MLRYRNQIRIGIYALSSNSNLISVHSSVNLMLILCWFSFLIIITFPFLVSYWSHCIRDCHSLSCSFTRPAFAFVTVRFIFCFLLWLTDIFQSLWPMQSIRKNLIQRQIVIGIRKKKKSTNYIRTKRERERNATLVLLGFVHVCVCVLD